MSFARIIFLVSIFCALAMPARAWETYVGRSMTVKMEAPADGNVIKVMDGGKELAVSFYGIGIPTLRQPMGKRAREVLAQMLPRGAKVTLTTVNQNDEGVISALVQVNDRSVNNLLVSEGLAWVDRGSCKAFFCRRWHIEEHLAQQERRGIWSVNVSTPPWQWGEIQK